MFLNYYGLREQPFGVTPDPRFLYLSAAHREALASLVYGIETNRGFLSLIAKPGMGKTTLLFHLLERFRGAARTAFLFQTQCNSREFMRFLLAELGYGSDDTDFVKMHEEFNKRLLQEARAGNRFIVVIDEAQNLDPSVLETVRLLSDFETPRAKLMQIILAGQPELANKLANPGLSQLRQRVSIMNGLQPLSLEETSHYIQHRLRIAGCKDKFPFSQEAVAKIFEYSEGIPRNINNFCFNAMSLGCALRQEVIEDSVIDEVATDLDISRHVSQPSPSAIGVHPGFPAMYPEAQVVLPPVPGNGGYPVDGNGNGNGNGVALTPAEAKAYMQKVVLQLKNYTQALERVATGLSGPERPN
ncbi:MAG TPA: AAA family ATPase [Terriglobales bacterium]|nr:AAA family ATPase [Terriglobales bacterium]